MYTSKNQSVNQVEISQLEQELDNRLSSLKGAREEIERVLETAVEDMDHVEGLKESINALRYIDPSKCRDRFEYRNKILSYINYRKFSMSMGTGERPKKRGVLSMIGTKAESLKYIVDLTYILNLYNNTNAPDEFVGGYQFAMGAH